MFRLVIVCGLVGVCLATPAVVRSRVEIEAFRQILERTKSDNGEHFIARTQASTLVNPEEISGKFDGDIVLDDSMIEDMLADFAAGRNAYVISNTKWPNNTVIWDFGFTPFSASQRQAIIDGIEDIEKNTCVKFRRREAGDSVFVSVTGLPGGCYANVGYGGTPGSRTLNLALNIPGVGCFRHATIVHEWMHILGFLHMHSTHDRDNYVQIVQENITPGYEHNFNITTSVDNFGITYDYVSCLHYGAYAFSNNGERTIVALQEHEGVMGQREYITDKDWLRINRYYECPGAWD